MNIQTRRIELGDGEYAIVYDKVLRGTALLHEAETRKHLIPVDGTGTALLSDMDVTAKTPRVDYRVDLVGLEAAQDLINEIYIFNQVTEWSFGPVDRETLNTKVSREQYKTLVKELDELYKPLPLPSAGKDVKS